METLVVCIGCDIEFYNEDDVRWIDHRHVPWQFRRFTGDASGHYCRECVDSCSSCRFEITSDETYHCPTTGDILCMDCYTERWTYCEGCDTEVESHSITWDEWSSSPLCPSCHAEENGREGLPVNQCRECDTPDVHFHLLTERYMCSCKAASVHHDHVVVHPGFPLITTQQLEVANV